jgi:hypothetical protein
MRHGGFFTALLVVATVSLSAATPLNVQAPEEQTIVVTSNADSGAGTLRQALQLATAGTLITFDPTIFPPTSPATIALTASGLPNITQGNLTIDASNAGVILDGSGLTEGAGLVLESDGNVIKGLWVLNFPEIGILIFNSSHNLIGGINATPGGPCTGDCNLISGNNIGVSIHGEGSVDNIFSGNYIGTDATGKASMGNKVHGIVIGDGAQDNLIGGDTEGERNLISGNLYDGVILVGSGTMNNVIRGNWIGLYLDQARQAFPSDMAISPDYSNDCTLYVATLTTGVHKSIDCGASWFEVNQGITEFELNQVEIPPDATDGNTLYTLAENGHLFTSTDGAAQWSMVSTSLEGSGFFNLALSAGFSDDRTMYASAQGWDSETPGGGPGVFKSSDGGVTWRRMVNGMSDENVLKVVASPDPAAKEILFALTDSGIEKSTDGGESWSTVPSPDSNLTDLALSPSYASDQTIFATTYADRIYSSTDGGTNWTGMDTSCSEPRFLALSPNFSHDQTVCYFSGENLELIYCSFNGGRTWEENNISLIGHLGTGATRTVFSPNYASDATIYVISIAGMVRSTDGGATWAIVRGLRDLGNAEGISIGNGASHNTIGPGNVLSNNHNSISINGAETAYNVIIGNLIGTDPTGTFAQANSGEGIGVHGGHHNVIGGSAAADRNIISGNTCAGVWLGYPDAANNKVIGNYIGTDITGTKALANIGEGGVVIRSGAQRNYVGGETEGEGNVISGNERDGVYISDDGTKNNYVIGNYIGTDASGTISMGNGGYGVSVNWGAETNVIGPGNVIAFNGHTGVDIVGDTTIGTLITRNSIYANEEYGIQQSWGGNKEFSAPTITFIGSRSIRGTASPNASMEIFSDEQDEGSTFEGSTIADGQGNFTFLLPVGRFTGPNVTATATDPEGNTSPFSQPEAPPAQLVTRELPDIVSPTQVSIEPKVLGTNLGLALLSVLFFGFTSTIFNSILVDYHDELLRAFRRLIPRRFAGSLDRTTSTLRSQAKRGLGRLLLMWLVVLLATAAIESFLDSEVGLLSPERFGLVITLFVSAVVVSALELGSDIYARRRWAAVLGTESKVQWVGMIIAIACVFLSRALDFKPGYLYGIVGAIYLMPKLTDNIKSGKRAAFVLMTVFMGGLILWIATAFLPGSLAELEPIFLTIFLISLQGVFFELFPLAITDGGDIWSWRRGLWFAFFATVFFCFYHFLLNPNASDVQALQQNGVQTLLILIAIFGLATLILWLLLPFRLGRNRASES